MLSTIGVVMPFVFMRDENPRLDTSSPLRIRAAARTTLPDIAVSIAARRLIKSLNEEMQRKPGPMIRCVACQHAVTASHEKIDVQSAHLHRFINPLGVAFDVACFSRALGCVVAGDATFEYTWFAGYAWQYALCEHCGEHLGWHYVSVGNSSFFGLIVNKLCL